MHDYCIQTDMLEETTWKTTQWGGKTVHQVVLHVLSTNRSNETKVTNKMSMWVCSQSWAFFSSSGTPSISSAQALNATLLREELPLVGTKAGQNPSRGNHTHSVANTIHSLTCTQVWIHTNKTVLHCLHRLISSLLHHSYMNDMLFSLPLSLCSASFYQFK